MQNWTQRVDAVKHGVEVTRLDAVDHGVELPSLCPRGDCVAVYVALKNNLGATDHGVELDAVDHGVDLSSSKTDQPSVLLANHAPTSSPCSLSARRRLLLSARRAPPPSLLAAAAHAARAPGSPPRSLPRAPPRAACLRWWPPWVVGSGAPPHPRRGRLVPRSGAAAGERAAVPHPRQRCSLPPMSNT